MDRLFSAPIVQIKDVAESAGVSAQTAGRYVSRLTDEGVLVPVDESRKWGRTFAAVEIIEMVYGELALEPPRS
jgi:Fic family protein